MTPVEQYRKYLTRIRLGKRVNDALYVHVSAIEGTPMGEWVQSLADTHGIEQYNLIKLDPEWRTGNVTLSWYPGFWDEGFPALEQCWTIKPDGRAIPRRFKSNKPILHRKETFLQPDHERVPEFERLTEQAEALGLFEETNRIGWSRYWQTLLDDKGYRVGGNRLVPV
jgi:hypothetical protein